MPHAMLLEDHEPCCLVLVEVVRLQGGIVRQIWGAAGAFRQIGHRQSLDDRWAPSNYGPRSSAEDCIVYTVKS